MHSPEPNLPGYNIEYNEPTPNEDSITLVPPHMSPDTRKLALEELKLKYRRFQISDEDYATEKAKLEQTQPDATNHAVFSPTPNEDSITNVGESEGKEQAVSEIVEDVPPTISKQPPEAPVVQERP